MDGLGSSGSSSWNRRTCGTRRILFKSHSLGLFLSTGLMTLNSLTCSISTSLTHFDFHFDLCNRAVHEKEDLQKGQQTRLRFFLIVFGVSFAYYIVPGYLFPSISAISFVCWIWKSSVTAQIVGSGLKGLGIGSFGLDWSTVAGFLGSPLAVPFFAIANFFAGFFIFLYILLPIFYWSNAYDAQKFPFYTSQTFEQTGHSYNITRILNEKDFDINLDAYNDYSKLYLSVMFALLYGLSFASLFATISHVALYDGK